MPRWQCSDTPHLGYKHAFWETFGFVVVVVAVYGRDKSFYFPKKEMVLK